MRGNRERPANVGCAPALSAARDLAKSASQRDVSAVESLAVSRESARISELREKFLDDHRELRGKSAVVTTLALNVLRGDEDLASALRLKGEELNERLLDHMAWEERNLLPLLARTPMGRSQGSALLREHENQRLRLLHSLTELKRPHHSFSSLAKECLALVRWLEVDMASEEREVLNSIAELR